MAERGLPAHEHADGARRRPGRVLGLRAHQLAAHAPYLKEWHARYRGRRAARDRRAHAGLLLRRDRDTVARAVERLGIPYPVRSTPATRSGATTGTGLAGRYLFDRTGRLAPLHYGEGEYEDTERAIGECLGIDVEPMTPVRPEDAPGVLLEPQNRRHSAPRGPRPPSSSCATGPTARTGSRPATPARRRGSSYSAGARIRGALGGRSRSRALRGGWDRRGRVAWTPPPRSAIHPLRRQCRPDLLRSMKRTSSWTTSNSETSWCRARGRSRRGAARAPRARSRRTRSRRRACPRATPRAPGPRCRSGASRRRGRGRPPRAGSSSRSCASRSPARGRTRAPSGARRAGGSWSRNRCRRTSAR